MAEQIAGPLPPTGTPYVPGQGPGGETANPALTLEEQLSAYKHTIAAKSAELKTLQAKRGAIKKPSEKDKKATAAYNARIASLDASIKVLTNAVTATQTKADDTQNKIYVRDGQYEKLLSGDNRDAFLAIETMFKSYGLESLAGKIYEYAKQGYSGDTISILLQDTSEYKTRFAANEERRKNGYPVLSAGEYLATEASFRAVMQAAGLPSGFYDQPADFNGWLGRNTSPTEIQQRVDAATQATVLANPLYKKALNQMGIDDGNLTAYFLDPDRALPYLQKSVATAQIGAEALRQNLLFDQSYAEQLATQGITADQAKQGYAAIADSAATLSSLAKVYGEDWTQRSAEAATFEGNAEAVAKQRRLLSQERGAFGGSAGAARGGLAQGGGAR